MTGQDLARLRARLRETLPAPALPEGYRRAGVLVPIVLGEDGAELVLTVRSARLRSHAGEIAFPGGAVEPGETVEDAARREALEEVGLDVPEEALVGRLAARPSPAGYLATPVVAALAAPVVLRPDPNEVAEAFTVPLPELQVLRPTTSVRLLRGVPRTLYHYGWRGRTIWGFTGNVLRELLSHLAVPAADEPRGEALP